MLPSTIWLSIHSYPLSCSIATVLDSYKPCHLLEASVAADLITQKVGVSVDAQEDYILCVMHVAFSIEVYWLQDTDS